MAYSVFPLSPTICRLNLLIAVSGLLTYPGIAHVLKALLRFSETSEERLLSASNTKLGFRKARLDSPQQILLRLLGNALFPWVSVPAQKAWVPFLLPELHCSDGIQTLERIGNSYISL